MSNLTWSETAPGVWTATVGEPEDFTPLSLLKAQPALAALEELPRPDFPLDPAALVADRAHGRTVVRFPLDDEEAIFGLGLQFLKVNHRGRTRTLRVNSDPIQDTGETHAPVPFYVSSRGYGVLVNTARIVTICCGSTLRKDARRPPPIKDRNTDADWPATPTSDVLEIVVPGGGAELLLFAGPAMLDVVRRYNLFCGGGALPPRWGLGFWHRVPTTFDADQALAEAREFRERDFPCDVIGLEPGWHTASYPTSYEWSPQRFPRPAEFVAEMRAEGFRINLWENPYVSPRARIHGSLEPLSGSHTVWGGLAPDYSLPAAQEILAAQHEEDHIAIGVSGYKLDECDGSELTGCSWMFPAHAQFPSGHDGEQMRQVYGLLLQQITEGPFRKHNRRTYGLVRASTAGASALPYVLYSDLYDHRQFVRALCNAGFSGLLWTPEIRAAGSAEEWVRRMQVVCFSPLAMLNAWANATKPWSFPEVEGIIRDCLRLRMRLLPYFYSAFARYHFDGTPPFRAMALEMGLEAAETDDQWMAGDSLLVAPMFAGQTSREVVLPPGDWHDFDTGERCEGGRTVRVFPGLDQIPLFVRAGGIIPMMPALPHAPRAGACGEAGEQVPLTVRHYGNVSGSFRLYDDDGETYDYERGEYVWRLIEVTVAADGSRQGALAPAPDGSPCSYGEVTWEFLG